ncbi:MAG: DUF3551 domain-containing protein [Bradyrhizobium sp.]
MRSALLALAAICAASAATPAAARDFPYCIKGCDFGAGAGDCSFSSLAQCQASASGRDATCAANPYFKVTTLNASDRNRSSQRRF